MASDLKPLAEQVLVITGATSGIGLATARTAASRGAAVMLAARNQAALQALVRELRAAGARADYVVADVSDRPQVEAIADAADAAFGGFDTWVNDAAAAVYGRLQDVPLEDQRRVFETTYWGVVHGSLVAAERLKRRGAGVLINIASVLADQAMPIQGVQSAAKHAVKGFTNALRMELIRDAPGVSVTLIKPSHVATPYKAHARNYLSHPATNLPPAYDPSLVAEAVLYAAERRVRELNVGGVGWALAAFARFLPTVAEPIYAWVAPVLQRDRAANHPRDGDNLYQPGRDLKERGDASGHVRTSSLLAQAQMNPATTRAVLAGALLAALAAWTVRDQLRLARVRARARARERARWVDSEGRRRAG